MLGTTMGSYRITQRLSSGSMGEVFVAEHKLLGRKAAIKLLLPHVSQRPNIVDRFFQEAKTTAAIGHPGIVEIFDFGWAEDNRAFLVMEFLEGETLGERIRRGVTMPPEQSLAILNHTCSALGAAHDKGIVHRDLKPDNIFLVRDPGVRFGERPKLLDFGIAKLQDSSGETALATGTGVVMGTPAYMSPEQCRGAGQVDHRADLYSVGCIFFELMCGRRPFLGEGAGHLIGMQQFMEPPRPTSIKPELSDDVEEVILKLLAKKPEERIQTASDVIEHLVRLEGTFASPSRARSQLAEDDDTTGRSRKQVVLPAFALDDATQEYDDDDDDDDDDVEEAATRNGLGDFEDIGVTNAEVSRFSLGFGLPEDIDDSDDSDDSDESDEDDARAGDDDASAGDDDGPSVTSGVVVDAEALLAMAGEEQTALIDLSAMDRTTREDDDDEDDDEDDDDDAVTNDGSKNLQQLLGRVRGGLPLVAPPETPLPRASSSQTMEVSGDATVPIERTDMPLDDEDYEPTSITGIPPMPRAQAHALASGQQGFSPFYPGAPGGPVPTTLHGAAAEWVSLPHPPPPTRSRRGLWLVIGAAVLALAIGGALLSGVDDSDVAATAPDDSRVPDSAPLTKPDTQPEPEQPDGDPNATRPDKPHRLDGSQPVDTAPGDQGSRQRAPDANPPDENQADEQTPDEQTPDKQPDRQPDRQPVGSASEQASNKPKTVAKVTVRLNSRPPKALVYRSGDKQAIGRTPLSVAVERSNKPVRFEFRLDGYYKSSVDIAPDGNVSKSVTLKKRSRKKPKKRPRTDTPDIDF